MDNEASRIEEHIEYVELLDSEVYDQENTAELIEISENATTEEAEGIMHEIITIADENDVNIMENYEEIQYVDAEVEVDGNPLINHENQTIFIHDGRKYIIPNDQLTNGDHTIILDEEDGQLIQQDEQSNEMIKHIDEGNDNSQLYYTSDMETEVTRQFAVLKDGKLHLTNIEDECNTESHEIQERLRHFESTLTNYEELNEEEQEDVGETGDDDDDDDDNDEDNENDKQLAEITGKNLITGQTISLSGILEKMKRKSNVNDLINIHAKQQRNTNNPQPQDYVLVPPVTRRVVVGRTQDGKRLVGRILQIQKKIQPNDVKINQSSQNTFSIAMPALKRNKPPRKINQLQQQQQQQQQYMDKKKEINEKKRNQLMQLRYASRSVLDENVARTLAGLMDLESINKKLKGRRLIVRHIQRRSREGKIITGSKKIVYYCGRLKRETAADNWAFVQEYPTKGFNENGIDLPNNEAGDNSDKVNLRLSDDGRSIVDVPESNRNNDEFDVDDVDDETTLTLYLTETQDEYGKKKTKVTIPEFTNAGSGGGGGGGGKMQRQTQSCSTTVQQSLINEHFLCKFCGKKFQSVASLKRHATVHDHSLRPLQCMTCSGRFTDESSLKKHMMLHTGLRPHKCHLCEKCFAHRGDLNFHLRTHDPIKRYECSVCKKQFNRHSNMLRHAEIHRPYNQYNNKNQDQDQDQNQVHHENEHDNNQSIIIAINEEYENNSNSNHESESIPMKAPFTCDQCGIQYNFSSSLTRHIVNVHLKHQD